MRKAIYISGLLGMLFLITGFIGMMLESDYNRVFLIVGAVLLVLVCLPLNLIAKARYNKKIKNIISSYEGKERKEDAYKKGEKKTKGWGMNDSPYRERKSGLTWGGGNIKGANATRGTRKRFLKK